MTALNNETNIGCPLQQHQRNDLVIKKHQAKTSTLWTWLLALTK